MRGTFLKSEAAHLILTYTASHHNSEAKAASLKAAQWITTPICDFRFHSTYDRIRVGCVLLFCILLAVLQIAPTGQRKIHLRSVKLEFQHFLQRTHLFVLNARNEFFTWMAQRIMIECRGIRAISFLASFPSVRCRMLPFWQQPSGSILWLY